MNTRSMAAPVAATQGEGSLLRGALALAGIALLGFGLLYSLLGVGFGQALFAADANGSLIERDGRVIGSTLVAQPFSDTRYFQPRPSAANYDPMAVSGSNQALSNPALSERAAAARVEVAQREGIAPEDVPGELITQSGGGIDPHISPRAAQVQVARVAKARGLDSAVVAAELARHTEGPQWGLLGQPRVNVLELNVALDALAATSGAQP